ncbi:unnamed protein product [Brachionus calyciflorus]|uniref:Methyltransferase FkbM domain-containing protein n=1 Tax=Brachionus calyciflorus TaxID=104777 RepID=A0A814GK67_9BILA|nr:unnamed protein product [Brachionus calyciflorus]
MKTKRKLMRITNAKILLILIVFVLIYFIHFSQISLKSNLDSDISLNIYDLSKYNYLNPNVQCLKTKTVLQINIILCLHDPSKDYTSSHILKYGIKEEKILSSFLKALNECEDCLAIDIGTHVGLFTLFAAKLGKQVISVEPFHDNIIRLQKAAELENLRDNITLLQYAVSNKKDEIKYLYPHRNIGQQSLLSNNKKKKDLYLKKFSKYHVRTITLNDLVILINSQLKLRNYQKAILKIDIESYEPYAFEKTDELFDRLDIRMVFMEWAQLRTKKTLQKEITDMIYFFTKRNYEVFDAVTENKLDINNWKDGWGIDVVWKKMN